MSVIYDFYLLFSLKYRFESPQFPLFFASYIGYSSYATRPLHFAGRSSEYGGWGIRATELNAIIKMTIEILDVVNYLIENKGVTLLFVLVIVLLVIIFLYSNRSDGYPYHLRDNILTKPELKFYRVLVKAVGNNAIVFAKPRIADIIAVDRLNDPKRWQRCFNRIAQKHFDFVLVDPDTLETLCAVELNDRSHEQKVRQARDIFVRKSCKNAGLPLLMFPTQSKYSVADLRQSLRI